jgi:Xaa-Pro aminopeptidase
MLTSEERAQLDAYHARVLAVVAPLVPDDVAAWLRDACAAL